MRDGIKPIIIIGSLIIFIIALSFALLFYNSNLGEVAPEGDAYVDERVEMVDTQLKMRGINDSRVLEAMAKVPRHLFIPQDFIDQGYADHPLPIGEGQTISQPYVVALMTQALNLDGSERVLEIGTGSGYQAAVLAEITQEVFTIEIREGLAKNAEEILRSLEYSNVHVKYADGYYGLKEHSPYDSVIITCAVNHIPPLLLSQLKDGGLLILPIGSTTYHQTLTLIKKQGEELEVTYLLPVRFVPMIGEALKAGGG